jgi:hypothetical protein
MKGRIRADVFLILCYTKKTLPHSTDYDECCRFAFSWGGMLLVTEELHMAKHGTIAVIYEINLIRFWVTISVLIM